MPIQRKQLPEIEEDPCTLIGIFANQPFYYVAHLLHRHLKLNFIRTKDFEFYNQKKKVIESFPTYVYLDEINGLLYLLLSNNVYRVIKGLQQPDCILIVLGRDCEQRSKMLIKELRSVKQIIFSQQFYPTAKKQNNADTMHKNIFSDSEEVDMYESVRTKRKRIVKSAPINDEMIDGLKIDLNSNFCDGKILNLV